MARLELQFPDSVKTIMKKFAQNSSCGINHIFFAAIIEKLGIPLEYFPNSAEITKILDHERYSKVSGKAKENALLEAGKIEYTPERYIKFIEINNKCNDEGYIRPLRKFILEDYSKEGLRQKIALIRDFNSRLQSLQELHRLQVEKTNV